MNYCALARRHLAQLDGSAYLAEQMLAAGNGGKPLFRVSQAPVIARPVFAVYRGGSDRSDLIRQALGLL